MRVVTGEGGAGKSTLCRRVAAAAREAGLVVAGIATDDPDEGTRLVTDLRSGEDRHFGTQSGVEREAGPDRLPGADPLTPSWLYDEGVFSWGNSVLARSTPCDLLVIDELGPLEILGDRGWFTAFDVLRRHHFGAALVVCRPSLVTALQDLVGPGTAVYDVTLDNRDALPALILEELCTPPQG